MTNAEKLHLDEASISRAETMLQKKINKDILDDIKNTITKLQSSKGAKKLDRRFGGAEDANKALNVDLDDKKDRRKLLNYLYNPANAIDVDDNDHQIYMNPELKIKYDAIEELFSELDAAEKKFDADTKKVIAETKKETAALEGKVKGLTQQTSQQIVENIQTKSRRKERKMANTDKADRLVQALPEDFDPLKNEGKTIAFADLLGNFNFDAKTDASDYGTVNGLQLSYAFSDAYRADKPVVDNIIHVMNLSPAITPDQQEVLDEILDSDMSQEEKISAWMDAIKNDPSLLILFHNTVKATNIASADIAQWFAYGIDKAHDQPLSPEQQKELEGMLESEFLKKEPRFAQYLGDKRTIFGSFFKGARGLGINESLLFNMLKTKRLDSKLVVSFGGFGNADQMAITPYIDVSLNNSVQVTKGLKLRGEVGVGGGVNVGGGRGVNFTIPMPHASAGADITLKSSAKKSLDVSGQRYKELSPTLYWSPVMMGGEVNIDIAGDKLKGIENNAIVIGEKVAQVLGEVAEANADGQGSILELLTKKFPKTSKATLEKQALLLQQAVAIGPKDATGKLDARKLADGFAQEWRNNSIQVVNNGWSLKSIAPGVALVAAFIPTPTLRATFSKIINQREIENRNDKIRIDGEITTGGKAHREQATLEEMASTLDINSPEYVQVRDNGDGTITVGLDPAENTNGLNFLETAGVYIAPNMKQYVKVDPATGAVTFPASIEVTANTVYRGSVEKTEKRKGLLNRLFLGKNRKTSEAGNVDYKLVIGSKGTAGTELIDAKIASTYTGEKIHEKKAIEGVSQESVNTLVQEKTEGILENVTVVVREEKSKNANVAIDISFDVPAGYTVRGLQAVNGRVMRSLTNKQTMRILKDTKEKVLYTQVVDSPNFAFGAEAKYGLTRNEAFPELTRPNIESTLIKPRTIVESRYNPKNQKAYNEFIETMKKPLSDAKTLEKASAAAKALFPELKDKALNEADLYRINGALCTVATTENKGYSKDGKFDKAVYDAKLKELTGGKKVDAPKDTKEMLSYLVKARGGDATAMAKLMQAPLSQLMDYRKDGQTGFVGYEKRMATAGYTKDAINLYTKARAEVGATMKNDVGYGRETVDNAVALVFGYDGKGTLNEKFTTHPEIATKQSTGESTFKKFERDTAGKAIIAEFIKTIYEKEPTLKAKFLAEVQKKIPTATEAQIKEVLINGGTINGIPVYADFGFAFYANCFNESIVMRGLQIGEVDLPAQGVTVESAVNTYKAATTNDMHADQKNINIGVFGPGILKNGKSATFPGAGPGSTNPNTTSNPGSSGQSGNNGNGSSNGE